MSSATGTGSLSGGSVSTSGLTTSSKAAIAIGLVAAGALAVYAYTGWSKSKAAEAEEESGEEEEVPVKKTGSSRQPQAAAGGKQADEDEESEESDDGESDEEGEGEGEEDEEEEEEEEEEDASSSVMSKKELLKLLGDMFVQVENLQSLLKERHASGQLSPEDVVEEHSKGIKKIEAKLHRKYKVTPKDLSRAYKKYDGDADVTATLGKLQQLFTGSTGDVELPADLTEEDFVEKFDAQNKVTMAAIEEVVAVVKASGKKGAEAIMLFQKTLLPRLAALEEESVRTIGLNQEEMMGALIKFSSNPRLQRSATEVQEFLSRKQQEVLSQ